ncbi:LysR family transcriptional regulator, partial [Clostridium saudiense]|nr:LysR family transcriptional regulator [Clostridium saudiense]
MFEELKTFIAVVDYKNFTKAAENLNLSQPSVSTHIKNLETFFGVTLINRSVKQKSISI